MDKQGEEQAVFKGRLSVDKYARLLGDTGIYLTLPLLLQNPTMLDWQ